MSIDEQPLFFNFCDEIFDKFSDHVTRLRKRKRLTYERTKPSIILKTLFNFYATRRMGLSLPGIKEHPGVVT